MSVQECFECCMKVECRLIHGKEGEEKSQDYFCEECLEYLALVVEKCKCCEKLFQTGIKFAPLLPGMEMPKWTGYTLKDGKCEECYE